MDRPSSSFISCSRVHDWRIRHTLASLSDQRRLTVQEQKLIFPPRRRQQAAVRRRPRGRDRGQPAGRRTLALGPRRALQQAGQPHGGLPRAALPDRRGGPLAGGGLRGEPGRRAGLGRSHFNETTQRAADRPVVTNTVTGGGVEPGRPGVNSLQLARKPWGGAVLSNDIFTSCFCCLRGVKDFECQPDYFSRPNSIQIKRL